MKIYSFLICLFCFLFVSTETQKQNLHMNFTNQTIYITNLEDQKNIWDWSQKLPITEETHYQHEESLIRTKINQNETISDYEMQIQNENFYYLTSNYTILSNHMDIYFHIKNKNQMVLLSKLEKIENPLIILQSQQNDHQHCTKYKIESLFVYICTDTNEDENTNQQRTSICAIDLSDDFICSNERYETCTEFILKAPNVSLKNCTYDSQLVNISASGNISISSDSILKAPIRMITAKTIEIENFPLSFPFESKPKCMTQFTGVYNSEEALIDINIENCSLSFKEITAHSFNISGTSLATFQISSGTFTDLKLQTVKAISTKQLTATTLKSNSTVTACGELNGNYLIDIHNLFANCDDAKSLSIKTSSLKANQIRDLGNTSLILSIITEGNLVDISPSSSGGSLKVSKFNFFFIFIKNSFLI